MKNFLRLIINRLIKLLKYIKYWKKWGEHPVSYGEENQDKTFYIIRKRASDCGLMAFVITNMGFISYALQKNYIPVIDMQNNMIDSLMEENELGKKNIWEEFYHQPFGYSLNDIEKSQNIVLGKDWGLFGENVPFPMYNDELLNNVNGIREYWSSILKNYIKPNDFMTEYICQQHRKLINDGEKVLGVLYRGTDFTSNKPKGHYISPNYQQLKDKIDEIMKEKVVDKIYLATEDVTCRNYLEEKYPGMIVSAQNSYVDYVQNSCINNNVPHDLSKIEAGRMYMASIYILAKSNYMLACRCSSTALVACLNTTYEYEYYWDLGRY